LAGASGIIYGVSGNTVARRQLGTKICQAGFALGGLILIGSSIFLGDASAAYSGLLLLIFGTAITGIGPRKALGRNEAGNVPRR
jgi:hypothetical protein